MLVGDPLDHAGSCPDVETPGGADGDAADMDSRLFPGGHRGPDEIAGAETEVRLVFRTKPDREAECVRPGDLPGPVTGGTDPERDRSRVETDGLPGRSDAGGIDPVGLRVLLTGPVELGASSGSRLDGKSRVCQSPKQRPPGGVDGRRVLQKGCL